jgi:hypothetical protein
VSVLPVNQPEHYFRYADMNEAAAAADACACS